MKIIKIIPIVLVFVVLIGCVTQIRTRKFDVDESKSDKKIEVGDWTILEPELIAFKNKAYVNTIPGFDTNKFEPLLIAKKPDYNNGDLKSDLMIDSVNIKFLETEENYQIYPTNPTTFFLIGLDTGEYKYFYFDENNNIVIPVEVSNILLTFQAIVIDSLADILLSKDVSIYMKRHDSKRLGLTYGD